MRARPLVLATLIHVGAMAGAPLALAHDNFRLTQAAIVASGGRMDTEQSANAGDPLGAVTALGDLIGGQTWNTTVTIQHGSRPTIQPLPAGTRAIEVAGALNEPATSVIINGVAAARQSHTFRATGVRLLEGPNPITVTATDIAGNRSDREITVWLDTRPPARPTIADQPAVTPEPTITLSGTKTAGTSVWINGIEAVPWNMLTTWSATVALVEGDNRFSIVTQDEVDHRSTAATTTIIVDALPPVITVTAPAITNFTPLLLSGLVDDRLTRVVANDVEARRSGLLFEVALPLVEGDNLLTITATSHYGYVSTRTLSVVRGTIPTITAVQPADGSRLYIAAPVTISVQAIDKERNPIEQQLWLDGQLLMDWALGASSAWTPMQAQQGVHAIEARARDGFGGSASQEVEVYVLRKPISPP